jgi:hypothetical protein
VGVGLDPSVLRSRENRPRSRVRRFTIGGRGAWLGACVPCAASSAATRSVPSRSNEDAIRLRAWPCSTCRSGSAGNGCSARCRRWTRRNSTPCSMSAATRAWDEDELRQLARMWADESGPAELKGASERWRPFVGWAGELAGGDSRRGFESGTPSATVSSRWIVWSSLSLLSLSPSSRTGSRIDAAWMISACRSPRGRRAHMQDGIPLGAWLSSTCQSDSAGNGCSARCRRWTRRNSTRCSTRPRPAAGTRTSCGSWLGCGRRRAAPQNSARRNHRLASDARQVGRSAVRLRANRLISSDA